MFFAAEGETHSPVLPIWQELVVGTIAFGVLCFVLMKYVFPVMEKTFKARVDAIEGGIKRAEQAQAEANELLSQYKAQLAEARTEAARIRDEARADAEGIRADIQAQAQQERDRIIAAGRDALTAERQSIINELRAEIGTPANAADSAIMPMSVLLGLSGACLRAGVCYVTLTQLLAKPTGFRCREGHPR